MSGLVFVLFGTARLTIVLSLAFVTALGLGIISSCATSGSSRPQATRTPAVAISTPTAPRFKPADPGASAEPIPVRLLLQRQQGGPILDMAFVGNRTVAILGMDGRTSLWSYGQRLLINEFKAPLADARHLHWDPDTRSLLFSDNTHTLATNLDGEVKGSILQGAILGTLKSKDWRWLMRSGQSMAIADAQFRTVTRLNGVTTNTHRWSTGTDSVAEVSNDGDDQVLRVWQQGNAPSTPRVIRLKYRPGMLWFEMALAPDGSFVFTPRGIATQAIVAVSTRSGRPIRTLEGEIRSTSTVFQFTSDGGMLAAAGRDIVVWAYRSGKLLWRQSPKLTRDDSVTSLRFADNEEVLGAGTSLGSVYLYERGTGRRLEGIGGASRSTYESFFAGNGSVAVAVDNFGLSTWDLEAISLNQTVELPDIRRARVSMSGEDLVIANVRESAGAGCRGRQATIQIIPASTADLKHAKNRTSCLGDLHLQDVATSADKMLLSHEPSRPIQTQHWPAGIGVTRPGLYLADLAGHRRLLPQSAEQHIFSGEFTKDDKGIIGRSAKDLNYKVASLLGIAKGPPNHTTVCRWGTDSGKLEYTIHTHGWRSTISDDNSIVASLGENDDRTRLYLQALPSGNELGVIGTGVTISDFSFYPESNDLLVGTTDGDLTHWRGGQLHCKQRPSRGIVSRIFKGAGGVAATTGWDGALTLWDLEPLHERGSLYSFSDGEWLAVSPRGAYAGTAEAAIRVGWLFEKPTELFSFEQFASDFNRPAVVSDLMRGLSHADVTAKTSRPPSVDFASPSVSRDGFAVFPEVDARSSRGIDVVRAYRDGRPVAEVTEVSTLGWTRRDLVVPLLPGANRIAIIAFDKSGLASNPRMVDLEYAGDGHRADLWVLAVGIGRYPELGESLQLFADSDATAIRDGLSAIARKSKRYEQVHAPAPLLNEQVTKSGLRAFLGTLRAMKPDDLAVVFLSGHGARPSAKEGTSLLPATSDGTAADLRENGIGWNDIAAGLAEAKGRLLVLVDSCHAGAVSASTFPGGSEMASRLARENRVGMLVFASSKGRQPSFEGNLSKGIQLVRDRAGTTSQRQGAFAAALLATLTDRRTDRNGDGAVGVREWFDAVSEAVESASGGAQVPWVTRRDMFGDFAVVEAGLSEKQLLTTRPASAE